MISEALQWGDTIMTKWINLPLKKVTGDRPFQGDEVPEHERLVYISTMAEEVHIAYIESSKN